MNDLTNTVYSDAARQLVGRIDESIREALDSRLGAGAWTLDDLFGRLTTVSHHCFDILYLDGQPILKLHPLMVLRTEDDRGGYLVTMTRKVERL